MYLITSEAGHILINTGLEDSTPTIRSNIESLGFRLEDVRILLCMQAHWDHAAALAEIKTLTGAQLWATPDDDRLLADGGFSDPHFGGRETFEPVAVDRVITDGEVIELGEIALTVHEHGGHTEGSSSYTMVVEENGQRFDVAIANMGTINDGKRLLIDPTYPDVADDFAHTFAAQKALPVDIWVAAHGSQYRQHEKFQPGDAYDPQAFVDPEGFYSEVRRLEALYLDQLATERAAREAGTEESR